MNSSRRVFLQQSAAAAVAAGALAAPAQASATVARMRPAGEQGGPAPYDVVVYGGTAAAVVAAVQAKRMGKTVALVCPETHLGGLTASGLGWTDSKDGRAVGGLAREFYHRVWKYYNNPATWTRQTRAEYVKNEPNAQPGPVIDDTAQVMWAFEPHAAEGVIEGWVAEAGIPVFRDEWLRRGGGKGVVKNGDRIVAIETVSGKRFVGKMFIDAGYEGDLMAEAGVSHRIGRDSASEFDEPLNGNRFPIVGLDRDTSDHYPGVSPYITPGKPESGLIAGIECELPAPPRGEADSHRLQSFNFRLSLTREPSNRAPFRKPDDYDEKQYELLFRLFAAGKTSNFTTQLMPNLKTDSNAQGAMSFDFVGGSYLPNNGGNYSEASYAKRREMVAAHRKYQEGLLWSLQNHERVPATFRHEMAAWGLARDEFRDNGNWPYQIYVREARRLTGGAMITAHHVQLEPGFEAENSIGLGSYSLDSHVVRRVVVDGKIHDEGGFYVWWDKPYPLPYGCITPKNKAEASNLLAPLTPSATHAAFGSIRMEPTYMILAQSAATAACLALDKGVAIQDVGYTDLAARLRADGQILTPPPPKTK